MTASTSNATQIAEYVKELLPRTSVLDGQIVVDPSAQMLLQGFEALYGSEGRNLLLHLLVRTHNAIQRDAEELAL